MNPTDLSLKDLTYILAVAEHRNFSRAAEICMVSQPALSKQIKRFEHALGVILFERSKRHVMLTPEGEPIIAQAQQILDAAETLVQLSQQHQAPLSGLFKLGVIASSGPYLLPYFVGELKQAYPDLTLIVKEGLTDPLLHDLKQGYLDALIAATTFDDQLDAHQIQAIPLFFEPFLLASKRTNKPSETHYKSNITVADIDVSQILLLEDGHCLKNQTLDLCQMGEQSSLVGFKATSLETLLQMTAAGVGIAIVPALAVARHSLLRNALRYSQFKTTGKPGAQKTLPGRTMALFSRKTYPHPQNISRLAQFIQSHLPELLK